MPTELFDSVPAQDNQDGFVSRVHVGDGQHLEVSNDKETWLVLGRDADVSHYRWFRVRQDV